ncbi:hypothetical protein [Haloarchaeobius litoreus]|uniref:CobQ/CobB/MinD/ParA nucleotide binding domain-containing protein n=1 Tax=Haloarchaeobius litoreus TaxID=755306 RepID=A0ABD6DEM0_9EURY
MTSTRLVAGTASHVGKSTVAAGRCRLLADRGVDVAALLSAARLRVNY